MQILKVAALSLIFIHSSAYAKIRVSAGTYEVAALVVPSKDGPELVFNFKTLSECRIKLISAGTESLTVTRPKGLWARFKVEEPFETSHGTAKLISFRPLYPKERIPLFVGNDLKAEK